MQSGVGSEGTTGLGWGSLDRAARCSGKLVGRAQRSHARGIGRTFTGLAGSRQLERRCVRGLRKLGLYATMSVLAFHARALLRALAEEMEDMRWMVRKVA